MDSLLLTSLVCGIMINAILGIAFRMASSERRPYFAWIFPIANSLAMLVVMRMFGNPWIVSLLAAASISLVGLQTYRVIRRFP